MHEYCMELYVQDTKLFFFFVNKIVPKTWTWKKQSLLSLQSFACSEFQDNCHAIIHLHQI